MHAQLSEMHEAMPGALLLRSGISSFSSLIAKYTKIRPVRAGHGQGKGMLLSTERRLPYT